MQTATTSPDVKSEYDEQHGNENRADAVSHDEHGVVADVTAYNTIDMQYRLHRTDVFPAERATANAWPFRFAIR